MDRERCCFFFQAEDGIRDGHVTGVQTCALPICARAAPTWRATPLPRTWCWLCSRIQLWESHTGPARFWLTSRRSEERRVGKECRSRWCGWYERKKEKTKRKYTAAESRDPTTSMV